MSQAAYAAEIARLIQQQGQNAADAERQRGEIWGGTLAHLGQLPSQLVAQRDTMEQNKLRRELGQQQLQIGKVEMQAKQREWNANEAFNTALSHSLNQDGTFNQSAVVESLAKANQGASIPKFQKMMSDADKAATDAQKARDETALHDTNLKGTLAAGVKANDYSLPSFMLLLTKGTAGKLLKPEEAQQALDMAKQDPSHIKRLTDTWLAESPEQRKLGQEDQGLDIKRQNELSQAEARTVEAANKVTDNERLAKAQQSTEAYQKGMLANSSRQADAAMIRAKRPPAAAGGGPATGDVKEAIAGMKDGTIPPQLPGRASKEYTTMMAEAHRQGYDLQGAVTDWNATQKHIASLNGAQQLRLNQAVNQLPELLDTVDALAAKWKGGRFPLLNKANLVAAKNGVYGRDVATVANQLDAQIADVTADLGNVYMGGNSPTDHALSLAAKSLSADWDEKVLHDMVALARQNVKTRQHSIANTGVAGASENNRYGNQAPAPVVEEWVRDANGKLVKKGAR